MSSVKSASPSHVVSPHTSALGRSQVALFITQSTTPGTAVVKRHITVLFSHGPTRSAAQHVSHNIGCLHTYLSGCLSPFLESHMPVVSSIGMRGGYCQRPHNLCSYYRKTNSTLTTALLPVHIMCIKAELRCQ